MNKSCYFYYFKYGDEHVHRDFYSKHQDEGEILTHLKLMKWSLNGPFLNEFNF